MHRSDRVLRSSVHVLLALLHLFRIPLGIESESLFPERYNPGMKDLGYTCKLDDGREVKVFGCESVDEAEYAAWKTYGEVAVKVKKNKRKRTRKDPFDISVPVVSD